LAKAKAPEAASPFEMNLRLVDRLLEVMTPVLSSNSMKLCSTTIYARP
jgi:hypothetical protein